jgi:hypothetical protein
MGDQVGNIDQSAEIHIIPTLAVGGVRPRRTLNQNNSSGSSQIGGKSVEGASSVGDSAYAPTFGRKNTNPRRGRMDSQRQSNATINDPSNALYAGKRNNRILVKDGVDSNKDQPLKKQNT